MPANSPESPAVVGDVIRLQIPDAFQNRSDIVPGEVFRDGDPVLFEQIGVERGVLLVNHVLVVRYAVDLPPHLHGVPEVREEGIFQFRLSFHQFVQFGEVARGGGAEIVTRPAGHEYDVRPFTGGENQLNFLAVVSPSEVLIADGVIPPDFRQMFAEPFEHLGNVRGLAADADPQEFGALLFIPSA